MGNPITYSVAGVAAATGLAATAAVAVIQDENDEENNNETTNEQTPAYSIGQWDPTYKYFDLDGVKKEREGLIKYMFEEPLKLKVVKYTYGLMRDEGLNI